ncbi:MAG: hypothetical protein QOG64_1697 [Acidimicrobiaceae bacterium]|jgi:hypothetical protein|nr:hypothetical protein [Acidimicrobiaceae bacterium]
MRMCLVVANQTLLGEELLQALLAKRDREHDCQFHLLVPENHPRGSWTEGMVHSVAAEQLEKGRIHFAEHGIEVTGEVGDANPIQAVGDILRRDPFDEIIVSTLAPGPSRWLRADVPTRLRRHFSLRVTHVMPAPVSVG